MKITRKIFMNKANRQCSITLPKKIIEQLRVNSKNNKYPKRISLEILNSKKIKAVKNGNSF